MKLTFRKEIVIDSPDVNITLNLKNETSHMRLRYTCPQCGGHGCRHSGNDSCNGGTVTVDLDPTRINDILDAQSSEKLKSIIQNLYSSMVD